jgi:hypothetical protein
MSLEDLKGKTIRVNFSLKPRITIKKLEEDLADMAKKQRISLATKNHRIALSRWIKSRIEDEIENFIGKLETGYKVQSKVPPLNLTPHELRRHNTDAVSQMAPGGLIQVSKEGKTSFYPAYNTPKVEDLTED